MASFLIPDNYDEALKMLTEPTNTVRATQIERTVDQMEKLYEAMVTQATALLKEHPLSDKTMQMSATLSSVSAWLKAMREFSMAYGMIHQLWVEHGISIKQLEFPKLTAMAGYFGNITPSDIAGLYDEFVLSQQKVEDR